MAQISTRAQELLDNHKHSGTYDIHIVDELLEMIEVHVNIKDESLDSWAISFNESKDEDTERAAICAGIFSLLEKTGLSYIFELSFREVENYLRDQGSLTAWQTVSHHQKAYRNMQTAIVKGLCAHLLMSNGASMDFWDDMEMRGKLNLFTSLCSKVSISLLSLKVGQIELVNIEENEIMLNFSEEVKKSKHFDAMLESLSDYFQFCLSSTSIKLVAQ